jgi:MFS family permease
MTAPERRAVAALASIFGLRMFGLFLILPVFALYAGRLDGTTPLLLGIALGVYGLTQACLQIPFGVLSDRLGRKPVIVAGLLVFAAGSVVAAMSETIVGVIAGRAIQGAGAISAAVLALTADLTREQQRTKAMALIGGTIGLIFLLSLMTAPVLDRWIGVAGIFWLTAVLALASIVVLVQAVPDTGRGHRHADVVPTRRQLGEVLANPQLLRMDLGIFVLHMALMALFVVIPSQLVEVAGLAGPEHWRIYVPVLVASLAGMLPLVVASGNATRSYPAFRVAIVILLAAHVVLWLGSGRFGALVAGLWLFFVGFNSLEAMLPSLTSRLAPAGAKGAALGIYNTFEFAGIFAGGAAGGALLGFAGPGAVYLLAAGLVSLWLVISLIGEPPRLFDSITLRFDPGKWRQDHLAERIRAIAGVVDVSVVPAEGLVYLKVDPGRLDNRALEETVDHA